MSVSLGVPRSSMSTFEGFTSPWINPARCKAISPAAMLRRMGIASVIVSRPRSRKSCDRLGPSTSSITRNGRPSSSSMLWIVTMFGWRIAAIARASASKLRRTDSEPRSSG
jgi:hypothetical protein